MIDAMGIFRTALGIAPLSDPERRRDLADVMVDTGSEYNWIPATLLVELGVAPVLIDRFETADGRVLEREVGFAIVYAGGSDNVVYGFDAATGAVLWSVPVPEGGIGKSKDHPLW